jgi:hypothetical protein
MVRDVAWNVENMGLVTWRIDILSLTKRNVPISQIEEVFRPNLFLNGYRYDRNVFTQVAIEYSWTL